MTITLKNKPSNNHTMVTLLAPVGSFESLHAAINAGADAIYFGVAKLNMRARAAANFTFEDLKEICAVCKQHNVKSCLTLNIVMYDEDLEDMQATCRAAKEAGISAVIATDIAAVTYARSIGLIVHMSTQCNISNFEAVRHFAQFADTIVLARELSLEQIHSICERIKEENTCGPSGSLVQIEIFIHGALCVAISGKCYMSLATYNASANRGACLQKCRRAYRVTNEETGEEVVVDNKYVMSPKDLCTITFLDKILASGVAVLKIEGRGRSPDYVATVVSVYKEAIASYAEGTYTQEKAKDWEEQLRKVYNRGFWHGGYYLGKKLGEWCGTYGSQATHEKVYLGKVINYFNQHGVAEILLETGELHVGDELLITGPTTGVIQDVVQSLRVDDKNVQDVTKGMVVTLPSKKTRKNDKVYKIVKKR